MYADVRARVATATLPLTGIAIGRTWALALTLIFLGFALVLVAQRRIAARSVDV